MKIKSLSNKIWFIWNEYLDLDSYSGDILIKNLTACFFKKCINSSFAEKLNSKILKVQFVPSGSGSDF